ncbi:MAG: copper amine oxidase N-terminal domain-containing protein [Bacillota bacterium]|nr:copper amine oxidase N-terminal domain-containing protein [Bacillota bacterium]
MVVKLNGNPLTFDIAPLMENGRTLVPLRVIGEALRADVSWNAKKENAKFIMEYQKEIVANIPRLQNKGTLPALPLCNYLRRRKQS